jgi:hypothetical protein
MIPKVFLSHASEDKERFVLEFAEKLRDKGVDVWLDRWEMFPGDSLIDKIFEEGLKNSQAVIIVLSKNSVNKKWVREELNASIVKRINEGSKLIPVIIDDCDVPECLLSTVWQKIQNINNYENELDRVIMSIFSHIKKPPLGSPPRYTNTIVDIVQGLTEIDSIILDIACQKAFEKRDLWIDFGEVYGHLKGLDIPDAEIMESFAILGRRGYIKSERALNGDIHLFLITDYAIDDYIRRKFINYDDIINLVSYNIINNNIDNNYKIAKCINQPIILVNHILTVLESRGFLKCSRVNSGDIFISNISPELKRILK